MASKEQTKLPNDSAQSEEIGKKKNSLYGLTVRALLILALGYFMVKPYLDGPKEDDSARQTFKIRGETMGTVWNASIVASPTYLVKLNNEGVADETKSADKNKKKTSGEEKTEDELVGSCEELLGRLVQRELDKIDALASTYRADSEVTLFNRSKSAEWFPVSEDLAKIVSVALDVSKKTEGAFDITVAPLVNLYRFGPNKTPLVAFPSDEEIDAIRKRVGYGNLEVRLAPTPALRKAIPDLMIDLSSVAKGYAVDRVADALEKAGLNDYLVEVGGEMRCRGMKLDPITNEPIKWTLGLQTPEILPQNAATTHMPDVYRYVYVESQEESVVVATSGDYNNFAQVGDLRFSHFVDPRTGKPTEMINPDDEPDNILGSVSVLSNNAAVLSCAQADAYATAFSVLGVEDGKRVANELGLSVVFLTRSDDAATKTVETLSDAFKSSIKSERVDEVDANAQGDSQKETKKPQTGKDLQA